MPTFQSKRIDAQVVQLLFINMIRRQFSNSPAKWIIAWRWCRFCTVRKWSISFRQHSTTISCEALPAATDCEMCRWKDSELISEDVMKPVPDICTLCWSGLVVSYVPICERTGDKYKFVRDCLQHTSIICPNKRTASWLYAGPNTDTLERNATIWEGSKEINRDDVGENTLPYYSHCTAHPVRATFPPPHNL